MDLDERQCTKCNRVQHLKQFGRKRGKTYKVCVSCRRAEHPILTCTSCFKHKDSNLFNRSNANPTAFQTRCRDCQTEDAHRRRAKRET